MVPTYLSRSSVPGRVEVLAELVTCLVLAAILFGLSWVADTPGELGAGAAGLGLALAGACFAFQSNRKLTRLGRALDGAGRSTQAARSDLESSYFQFVEVMARALDARDPYTAGHSIRVGAYSRAIALQMGLPSHEAEIIRESHPLGEHRSPRFYRGFDLKSDCHGRSDQSREMRDHLVGDAPCIPADPSGIQIHGGMEPLWPARPALAGL